MKRSKLLYWGFMAPCIITFSLAVIIPFLKGVYYSFTSWDGIKAEPVFLGIDNYITIFTRDSAFLSSFRYTLFFTLAAVIIVNVVALLLSMLVTQALKGKDILRSIFFMPNLVGGILVGFAWQFIFTQVLDTIGTKLNLSWLCNWLSTTTTGTAGLLIVVVWQMSGYMMLIYIAQIQNISDDLIESSAIDGANTLKRFIYIKLPLMMPALTIGIFLTLSNCFKLYDQNLALTDGGPYNSTEMLSMNIYRSAFMENKLGQAQAKAVIFLVVVAIITLTQLYSFKKKEVEM